MIFSGGCDGLIAISSPTTGMTVRVITDHKGAPITCFDVAYASVSELIINSFIEELCYSCATSLMVNKSLLASCFMH